MGSIPNHYRNIGVKNEQVKKFLIIYEKLAKRFYNVKNNIIRLVVSDEYFHFFFSQNM